MEEKNDFLEPVLNGNKPAWLTSDFKTEPPGKWQCKKCGCFIVSPDKPEWCFEDQGGCNRTSTFNMVTKPINPDLWILPKWKDIKIKDLELKKLYQEMDELIRKLIIFSKEIEYKIFTLWIISTWKLECWDTVGFPVFIGIPNSGKSRALRIISQLAYRATKTSGLTSAVVPRICHYYNVTLLLDEAHNKLNPRTDSGSQLLDFAKDSYKKGSVYVVCDNNLQDNVITYRNFGFKAFAGEKTFNPALLTRAFSFWMEKEEPEIAKLSYVEKNFVDLRTKLLNYKYKTHDPKEIGNDFVLKGRTREIFESIVRTGKHLGIDVSDIIEYAIKQDRILEEELQSTNEYDILRIIKDFEGNPTLFPDDAPNKIKTETILEQLNWLTGDNKEDKSARQKLGFILKNMGITTKRERDGRTIFLQEEDNKTRLEKLFKRYAV